tara:strand:- start:236 stop:757 length:522 start_codon:yes stop_codon:yes gene_type:complete
LNNKNLLRLGILGGTFDPPHKGHLTISTNAKKQFRLKKVIWAITERSPFKKKASLSINERIKLSKKIINRKKYIRVVFFEKKINSNKTINLVNYLKKSFKNYALYFIMGADNLINFHKWYKWKNISSKCKILVYDRKGYKTKSLKSISYNILKKKGLIFINFKKVNISSSKLR